MIGNRRYWKACAKQFLSGKWGIAILAMMAAPALNTIGTMAAIKLFPGDSFLAWLLGEAFLFIVSLLSMVISTGYNFMLTEHGPWTGVQIRKSDLYARKKDQTEYCRLP